MSEIIEYPVAFQWDKTLVGRLWHTPNWFRLIWNKPNGVFAETGSDWVLSSLNDPDDTFPDIVRTGDWFVRTDVDDGPRLIRKADYSDWRRDTMDIVLRNVPMARLDDREVGGTKQTFFILNPFGEQK